jgi:hypothetical protein
MITNERFQQAGNDTQLGPDIIRLISSGAIRQLTSKEQSDDAAAYENTMGDRVL